MTRLAYWLCRLFGTVPCRACFHPGRAHVAGDNHRVLPVCLMCSDYTANLREIQHGAATWRDVYIKAIHPYCPEPYR